MMQAAHLRNTDHPSLCGRLHRPWFGRIFLQSQVTAGVMVVVQEGLQMVRQAGLVENNHVIEAFAAKGPNDPVWPGNSHGFYVAFR